VDYFTSCCIAFGAVAIFAPAMAIPFAALLIVFFLIDLALKPRKPRKR
jgi:hypothetical protein